MAYAGSSNFSGKQGAGSEPSGKGGGGTYASKAGSVGCKGEPTGGPKTPSMSTKGNAKKL